MSAIGGMRRTTVPALLVGVVAAVASLARILAANPDALNSLLWAEDGLFPLCVVKSSMVTCLVDPFAGYLLFVPRVLAQVVAWFPLEAWARVANVQAAVVAGAIAALSFAVVRRAGVGWGIAAIIAMLPTVMPIAGFESVNVTASVYMLLLYLMALALSLPGSRPQVPWLTAGLVVTALTIPSAAFLAVPIAVQWWRGGIRFRQAAVMGSGLALGLSAQLLVILTAPGGRPRVNVIDGLGSWLEQLPNAVLSN